MSSPDPRPPEHSLPSVSAGGIACHCPKCGAVLSIPMLKALEKEMRKAPTTKGAGRRSAR